MNKYITTCVFVIGCLISFGLPAECWDCEPEYDECESDFCGYEPSETTYLGVFGGFDQLMYGSDRLTAVHTPKFMGGCNLGIKFRDYFRVEGEFAYRRSLISYSIHSARLDICSVMANLCLDIPIGKWTPYFGLGLGYAKTLVEIVPTYDYDPINWRSEAFAWQFLYGLNYRVCDKTDLGIKWTLFSSDRDDSFHQSCAIALNRYF